MEDEKKELVNEKIELEEQMDRRMEQHKSTMAVAAEELKSCKLDMMQKIAEVGSKGEKIQGTFMKEIKVKDEIIKDLKKEIKKHKYNIDTLTLKLKVPQMQKKFLEENGKLDEFIEAKQLGKEPVAKWCLLEAAAVEI